MSLKGGVAIVADGNSGIGMESAVALATAGASIVDRLQDNPYRDGPDGKCALCGRPKPKRQVCERRTSPCVSIFSDQTE